MTIQIHSTLTRTKAPLEPLQDGQVGMYLCGPTVYDDCHVGHLMGPVVFDTIARWMSARGLKVRFVNNITDIDDKIINRAASTGEDWKAIADRYTDQYLEFQRELGVTSVTDHPRCTDYVPQMVQFIQELIDVDRAYVAENGVYYDVQVQEGYGKLSGRKLEDMQAGARVEAVGGLRHPADFALWKFAKPGEPTWDSPWGAGRPGWHIECSVMSSSLLGGTFDIHGGGDDLKFPHHENEIAQSEAHGDDYARVWMHNGLIQYGGKKISKSDPRMKDENFSRQFQARCLIDTHGAPAVRFFLMRSPYRRPVDFEPSALAGARTGLLRLYRQLGAMIEEVPAIDLNEILLRKFDEDISARRARFCESMDDDFNTGEAVAELFAIASRARELDGEASERANELVRDLGRTLGLFQPGDLALLENKPAAEGALGSVLDALLTVRADARGRKDFATADGVRDAFTDLEIGILDSADGSSWELRAAANDELMDRTMQHAIALRALARERKDFPTSDAIRDRLQEAGVHLLDGADGSTWEMRS
ncbi:MAG: cysteinyl-tRNA synthetase [Planctomycetota bacterium]|jgi:cysteinyl-tRNA synthetase